MGDINPSLPDPPPGDDGCGIEQIIVMAIVVVATAYGVGMLMAPQGATAMTIGQTITAGFKGMAAAATGGLGSFGAAGAGALAGGAAIGNVAGQIAGNALGTRRGFDLTEVATSAAGAYIGASILPAAGAGNYAGMALRAAGTSTISQGLNMLVGRQSDFSWRGVVASAIAAPIASAVANGASDAMRAAGVDDLLRNITSTATSSVVGQGVYSAVTGGKMRMDQVASDVFNNVIGQAFAGNSVRGASQQTQELKDALAPSFGELGSGTYGINSDVLRDPEPIVNAQRLMNNAIVDSGVGSQLNAAGQVDFIRSEKASYQYGDFAGATPANIVDTDFDQRARMATAEDIARYETTSNEITALNMRKIFNTNNHNHYVIGAYLDGTWVKRGNGGLEDSTPGINSTNVGLLQWMSRQQSQNFRNEYFEGVGTDTLTKYVGGGTGAGISARVEAAYQWSSEQANIIRRDNPEATFDFMAVGFSRGSAAARMLLRAINERGIPDFTTKYEESVGETGQTVTRYARNLIEPRQANLNAVIFDTVATGFAEFYNLSVPERTQVYHPIAGDEMRSLFSSTPLAKPGDTMSSSWYQPVLPGDHSDIGNNHDRGGLGDWNLKLAHQFMTQQFGLPLSPIPDAYKVQPNNVWIHDLSGRNGVPPSDNTPYIRSVAPAYQPYVINKGEY